MGDAGRGGIVGMDFDERLRQVAAEARAFASARHGVPLVAHAAGVEAEREGVVGGRAQGWRRDGDETGAAIRRHEAAAGEEADIPARCLLPPPRNPGLPGLRLVVRKSGRPDLRRGRVGEGG